MFFSLARFLMYKCPHSYGDEPESGVVVRTIKVRIRGDLGFYVALAKEDELPLRVWNHLAPQVEGKFCCCSAEHSKKVVLPELDGLFCNVPPVVFRRYKLVCHVGVYHFFFVFF